MKYRIAVALREVLRLAAVRCGLPLGDGRDAVAQYCTTNVVLATNSVIAKNYANMEAFAVETAILERAAEFGFSVPKLLYSHGSAEYGYWSVQERVEGLTLADELPDDLILGWVVDRAVEAVVEFERKAVGMLPTRPVPWRWADGVRPLAGLLTNSGRGHAAATLLAAASACDEKLDSVARAPCFDLYLRNILWRAGESQPIVTFVDFDKAARFVPAGEQLSHLGVSPRLKNLLEVAVDRYAELSGHPRDLVQEVVGISCFFRAMSGARDSMPWSVTEDRREGDPHKAERATALQQSIIAAISHAPAVCVATGDLLSGGQLRAALDAVEQLGRGDVRWRRSV